MAIERRIYSSWAFTENEREKAEINREIYEELKQKYNIAKSPRKYNHDTKQMEDVNFDDYDIILEGTPGYAHCLYTIHKNNTNLTNTELALICDDGNLCYGYMMQGSKIRVSTD